MDVDVQRQRIGLSLRLDDEPGQNAPKKGRAERGGKNGGKNHGRGGGRRQGAPEGRRQASGSMADALKRAGFGN